MLRGSPSQLAARTASHAEDLTSYRLSCAATLAVVFRERDAHRKRIAEGGERSTTLSKQYAEDRQWICLDDPTRCVQFRAGVSGTGARPNHHTHGFF